MALIKFLWLRRLIRRNTNPVPEDKAEKWKRRLSIGYAILAWQAFGLVGYMMYSGKADWAAYYGIKDEADVKSSPAQLWSKTLGIKEATVYRVSGLSVSKYEIHNDPTQKNSELQTDSLAE